MGHEGCVSWSNVGTLGREIFVQRWVAARGFHRTVGARLGGVCESSRGRLTVVASGCKCVGTREDMWSFATRFSDFHNFQLNSTPTIKTKMADSLPTSMSIKVGNDGTAPPHRNSPRRSNAMMGTGHRADCGAGGRPESGAGSGSAAPPLAGWLWGCRAERGARSRDAERPGAGATRYPTPGGGGGWTAAHPIRWSFCCGKKEFLGPPAKCGESGSLSVVTVQPDEHPGQ